MNLEEAILAIEPGAGSTLHKISSTLAMIGVVERNIHNFQQKYPEIADDIYEMFLPFKQWVIPFSDFDIDLWDAHVYEVLERMGRKLTKPQRQTGTDAECLLALYHLTVKSPVAHDVSATYWYLWNRVLPDHTDQLFGTLDMDELDKRALLQETYPGAIDDILIDIRRKIANARVIEYTTGA